MNNVPKPNTSLCEWIEQEGRAKLLEEHPSGLESDTQAWKILGEMWNELDNEVRDYYNKDAAERFAVYLTQQHQCMSYGFWENQCAVDEAG